MPTPCARAMKPPCRSRGPSATSATRPRPAPPESGGPVPEQSVDSQLGEVRFRRLLVEQQVDGRAVLADEYDGAGIRGVLEMRMADTRRAMEALRARGVTLGPYLELGAERGQRALALENDLGVTGAAADLSVDMLRSAAHYAGVFGRPRIPMRV